MAYLIPESHRQITYQGQIVPGARLYVFSAATGDPLPVYQDYALTVPHTHPVIADAFGLPPAMFLDVNVLYRLRVEAGAPIAYTDASGGTLIYEDMTRSTDTSSTGGGGSGGDTPITERIQTGTLVMFFDDEPRTGFIIANGQTIGSASSGANAANSAYEALYKMLWNNSAGDEDPLEVTGGRGASADADWSNNKPLAVPDYSSTGPMYLKV